MKNDLDNTIAELRQASLLKPDDADIHLKFALVLMERGDLDSAITEFSQAVQLNPNSPYAHFNLGAALAEKGDLDGASPSTAKLQAWTPSLKAYGRLLTKRSTERPGTKC